MNERAAGDVYFEQVLSLKAQFLGKCGRRRFNVVPADFEYCLFGLVQVVRVKTNNCAVVVHTNQQHATAGVGEGRYLVSKGVSAREFTLELEGGVLTEADFFD